MLCISPVGRRRDEQQTHRLPPCRRCCVVLVLRKSSQKATEYIVFFGCDQILHTKCADLNLTGVTALKENPTLKYICFKCRKNQICLNDVQKKCETVLMAVEELSSNQHLVLENVKKLERSFVDLIKNACEKAVSECFEQLRDHQISVSVDHGGCDPVVDLTYAAVLQQTPLAQPSVNYKRKVGESSGFENSAKKVKTATSNDLRQALHDGQWLRSGKRRVRSGQNNTFKSPVIVTPSARPADNAILPNGKAKSVILMEQTVVIKPKVSQDVNTTKSEIRHKLDPVAHSVKDVFYSNNGNVAIRCDSHSAAMKLLDSAKSTMSANYEIDIQKALRPRLKIVGFSTDFDADSFLTKFRKQNDLPDCSFIQIVRFTKSKRDKENPMSVILEVDALSFKQLIKAKIAYVGWERCPVSESIDVLRCYRCSEFGHIASICTKPLCCPKCTECHEVSECTSEYEKCINCTIVNKDRKLPADQQLEVNHCSWSTECPMYLKRLNKSRQRIDYSS